MRGLKDALKPCFLHQLPSAHSMGDPIALHVLRTVLHASSLKVGLARGANPPPFGPHASDRCAPRRVTAERTG